MMERTWSACQDAETIVYSTMGIGGYHAAEKLGVPCFLATPLPGLAPTSAFANPSGIFPALPLGGRYNRLTYYLNGQLLQAFTGKYINRWRQERLHLPAIPFGKYPYHQLHGKPLPVLGSYSPLVFPGAADWGRHIHITGYWTLQPGAGWKPPAALIDFLEAGPAPVYVGFGSMVNRTPRETTRLVCDALARAGQRGVLATGWGGLDGTDLPDSMFAQESVPHAWLFPRMAAVVHHGGSGTTGAGLRAGVPSVLVPHMGDQPFWAGRVAELGVGPWAVPRRELTADRLADAIECAITDQGLQTRAAALGERLRAEDGVGRTIRIIEGKE
jgi:UDP:flavonoid glycosyltransferase YjiC (YdhE family)